MLRLAVILGAVLFLAVVASFNGFAGSPAGRGQSASPPMRGLTKVDLPTVIKEGKVHVIKDDIVATGDVLLKRVEVLRNEVIVTFENKTAFAVKPSFQFAVYDAYGLRLAEVRNEPWILSSMQPKEVYRESIRFRPLDKLDEVVQYANIKLPEDWDIPVYLVVAENPDKR